MNVLSKFLLVAIFLSSFTLMAQDKGDRGWISSGGEIFRFAHNPWFLDKNNTQVEYCVLVDKNSITASEAEIRLAISDAIDYWKSELGQPMPVGQPGLTSVGNIQLTEVAQCHANTPLVFKFGLATLTQDELDYFLTVNPSQGVNSYVGVSVRQEYETVQMRGKGFVYIASDTGPVTYRNGGQTVKEAWRSPKLLRYALIHELGHVFGISHTGSGVMSETFLDQLLHPRFAAFFEKQPFQPFLRPPQQFEVCTLSGSFSAAFFQVAANIACLRFEAEPGFSASYKVFSKTHIDAVPVEIGIVRGTAATAKEIGQRPAVMIYLTDDQQVFSAGEKFINTFMVGPIFRDIGMQGFFRTTASPKPYPIQMELRPEGVTIVSTVSGQLMPVLVYSPPTLLNLLFGIP